MKRIFVTNQVNMEFLEIACEEFEAKENKT
jgi:hypothetical protein